MYTYENKWYEKSDISQLFHVAPEKTMPFPDKWDEEWPIGKYVFENKSLPIKRLRNDIAPKNFQLGAIARMILSLG